MTTTITTPIQTSSPEEEFENLNTSAFNIDTPRRPVLNRSLLGFARAGIAFFINTASVMSELDPSFEERQYRASSARISEMSYSYRQQITLLEARQVALEILLEARSERNRLAKEEFHRTVLWGLDYDL